MQERDGRGRPVALAVARDGSLLVADDTGGTTYRISFNKPAEHAASPAADVTQETKPK